MTRLLPTLLLTALAACVGDKTPTDSDTSEVTDSSTPSGLPLVEIETDLGSVVVEIDTEQAPVTGENFLQYVDDGFYDGDDGLGATLFHRVIPDFMAQGGGVLASGELKTPRDPIANESDNGLSNLRGTIAMARTSEPDSANSQFFINVVDNEFLDIDGSYPPGYAVFGSVVSGMEVVDALVGLDTDSADRPLVDHPILDCERVE